MIRSRFLSALRSGFSFSDVLAVVLVIVLLMAVSLPLFFHTAPVAPRAAAPAPPPVSRHIR